MFPSTAALLVRCWGGKKIHFAWLINLHSCDFMWLWSDKLIHGALVQRWRCRYGMKNVFTSKMSKQGISSCTIPIQHWWIIHRTTRWLNSGFFALLFIVNCLLCIESSLSFPLFLFSWHSWRGKSRIPNEVQNITSAGRNFGSLAAKVPQCSRCMNLHW